MEIEIHECSGDTRARGEQDLDGPARSHALAAPRYELSLVAGQLLAADKTTAAQATEEQLKKRSWAEGQMPGKGGLVFWGILALVVVVLLFIISRLLPKASEPAA